jgi:hypothetical protein
MESRVPVTCPRCGAVTYLPPVFLGMLGNVTCHACYSILAPPVQPPIERSAPQPVTSGAAPFVEAELDEDEWDDEEDEDDEDDEERAVAEKAFFELHQYTFIRNAPWVNLNDKNERYAGDPYVLIYERNGHRRYAVFALDGKRVKLVDVETREELAFEALSEVKTKRGEVFSLVAFIEIPEAHLEKLPLPTDLQFRKVYRLAEDEEDTEVAKYEVSYWEGGNYVHVAFVTSGLFPYPLTIMPPFVASKQRAAKEELTTMAVRSFGTIECVCGVVNPLSSLDKNVYCSGCGRLLLDISKLSSSPSAPKQQAHEHYQPAQGQSRLGKDIQTGKPVDVPQASRRQGLYIIGATGTGKSGLIENQIIQDIKQGLGVGLLDPHGDLTEAVLSRLPADRFVDRVRHVTENDVILLDIADYHYPFGLNLFTCSDPTDLGDVSRASDKVMHVFKKLWGKGGIVVEDAWGVLLEEILGNATMTFLEYSQYEAYTMAEIPLLLEDKNFRNHIVQKLSFRHVKNYWLKTYNLLSDKDQLAERRSTLNRAYAFLRKALVENIVGQAQTTIDFRAVMDERKILLVKLDNRLEDVTSLIGSMIIAEILDAAYSRSDLPANKRKQFNLYADEFHRFATEDFATLLTEARKFGIATTIAHQARFQPGMTDGVRAVSLSAANLVVFRVQPEDATELAGKFDITPQEAWEEETKPERHERKEEQVTDDVEEDIQEISQNPVDYLVSARGSHGSAKVREAIQVFLAPRAHIEYEKNFLNNILVPVMEKRLEPGTKALAERIEAYIKGFALSWLIELLPDDLKPDKWWTLDGQQRNEFKQPLLPVLSDLIWAIVSHQSDSIRNTYERKFSEQLHAFLLQGVYVKESFQEWYSLRYEPGTLPRWTGDNAEQRERARAREREREQQARGVFEQEKAKMKEKFDNWPNETRKQIVFEVSHLVTLCEELRADPIMVSTGQKRMVPRKRTQIHYLTHPRQTISHPQRSYADMLNEVASQLTNLPDYTARVKIVTEGRLVEHTIRTLKPEDGLQGKALQERIARIKEQNIQDGYLRERTAVEEEIRQRQAQCSHMPAQPGKQTPQPPEEPPISRRQQH